MKTVKIFFSAFMIIAHSFALSGCQTATGAWLKEFEVTEEISHIYLSEDRTSIGVFGDGVCYIFETPPGLSEVLFSPLGKELKADFSEFSLYSNRVITGTIFLAIKEENSSRLKATALNFGFTEKSEAGRLELNFDIVGKKFNREYFNFPVTDKELNNTYKIKVKRIMRPEEKVFHYSLIPFIPIAEVAKVSAQTAGFGLRLYTYPIRGLFGDSF